MPQSFQDLLEGNQQWAAKTMDSMPEMFEALSKGQNPNFLWIGCSDSRVPASEVTNQPPGSIFVHRNIANMVVTTDFNLLSVVYYAVVQLKVEHIVVCGHYGCGGVQAAMSNQDFDFLDNWLSNIKDVYRTHATELDAIEDETERANRFVEINVAEQVRNLSKISFIQDAWEQGEFPKIHGCVYQLHDGRIKDLGVSIHSKEGLEPYYQLKK